MKVYLWVWVMVALGGSGLISVIGRDRGWDPLATFLLAAGFLIALAVARGGVVRVMVIFLIFVQAIPAFGIRTVGLLAPPLVAVGLALMWSFYIRRLGRSRLVPSDQTSIAPGARIVVEALQRLGFQVVGSANATGPGYKTTFTYLVSADRLTYAIATDRIQTLASRFGERILVTTDRASMPTPPIELRQVIAGAVPELYQAHKDSLELLRGQGHQPNHLVPGQVIEQSEEYERTSLDFVSARPWWLAGRIALGLLRREAPDSRPVRRDPETMQRIEQWASKRPALS